MPQDANPAESSEGNKLREASTAQSRRGGPADRVADDASRALSAVEATGDLLVGLLRPAVGVACAEEFPVLKPSPRRKRSSLVRGRATSSATPRRKLQLCGPRADFPRYLAETRPEKEEGAGAPRTLGGLPHRPARAGANF